MIVLDLFCGLRGWSRPFVERGHGTVTLDLDPRFGADVQADILQVRAADLGGPFDVVLASPPCEAFSVMRIGKNWTRAGWGMAAHQPKTATARAGEAMVARTLALISELGPKFFVIENPRGKMRRLPMLRQLERRTVTWCQYGEPRMKPTDLWGGFPPSLRLLAPCSPKDPCHVRAPRGSYTGTQGMDRAESAKIPYELALAVCIACERDL